MSSTKDFFRITILIILAFAFGGAGLGVLFNSDSNLVSIIGGSVLIGIAIAVIYQLVENG